MLKDIKLHGDSVADCMKFWNSIVTALVTILGSNSTHLLPRYEHLSRITVFDPEDHLLPSPTHPDRADCESAYKIMSRVLKRHLDTPSTISSDLAPCAAIELDLIDLDPSSADGFYVLKELIFKLSPQLDGKVEDQVTKYFSLTITTDSTITSFYKHALQLYREFTLQNDDTGAVMKLCERFISQLLLVPSLDCIIQPVQRDLMKHIKKNGYVSRPFTIRFFQTIYDEIILTNSPNMKLTIHPDRACNSLHISSSSSPSTDIIASTTSTPPHPYPSIHAARITHQQFQQHHRHPPQNNYRHPYPSKSSSQHIHHRSPTPHRHHNNHQNTPSSPSSGRHKSTSSSSSPNIDICCPTCGKTNREIIKNIHRLHPCTDHNCIFRGPSFIPDKPMKETIQQYNVKNGSRPSSSIKNTTFESDPPVSPHLPHVKQTVSFDIPSDDTSIYEDSLEQIEDEAINPSTSTDANLPSSPNVYTPLISSLASSSSSTSQPFSHLPLDDTTFISDPSDSYHLRL